MPVNFSLKEQTKMSKPTYEVTKRYRDKAIGRVSVDLKKDLVDSWALALKDDGITKAEFIRKAITEYLTQRAGE